MLVEVILKNKRYKRHEWLDADPILGEGELGFESDTLNYKIGDGFHKYSEMEYISSEVASRLQFPRYLGYTKFDGTRDLTPREIGFVPYDGGNFTGAIWHTAPIYFGTPDDKSYYIKEDGDSTLKNLIVTDTFTVNNIAEFVENVTIDQTLFFEGDTNHYINENADAVLRNLHTTEDVTIGDSTDRKTLLVTGTTTLEGNTNIGGNTEIAGTLNVQSNTTIGDSNHTSSLTVWGSTVLKSDIEIDSDTDATVLGVGALVVKNGGASVKKQLRVGGNTTISSKSDIDTDPALQVAGGVIIGKQLSVIGNTQIGNSSTLSTLTIWGDTIHKAKVFLNADPLTDKEAATKKYVDTQLASFGAWVYKGTVGYTIDSGTKVIYPGCDGMDVPTTGIKRGDVYFVAVDGNYAGYTDLACGDMLIAKKSGSGENLALSATADNWSYIPSGDKNEVRLRYSDNPNDVNVGTVFKYDDLTLGEASVKQVLSSINQVNLDHMNYSDDNVHLVTVATAHYYKEYLRTHAWTHEANVAITGTASINNTTNSTSYSDGALVVLGGMGIAKDIYTNGNINLANGKQLYWGIGDDYAYIKTGVVNTDIGYLEIGTGKDGNEPIYIKQKSGTSEIILDLLDRYHNTSFPGNVYIGTGSNKKELTVYGNINARSDILSDGKVIIYNSGDYSDDNPEAASLYTDGSAYISNKLYVGTNLNVRGLLNVGMHTTLGSFLDVVGNTTIGNNTNAADLLVYGAIETKCDTDSTSTADGALTVKGGAGIGKNLNVGGKTTITGKLTANGGISAPSHTGNWISGMNANNAAINFSQSVNDSWIAYLYGKNATGNIWNFGSIGDELSLIGFNKDRTANGYDWRIILNSNNGDIIFPGLVQTNGNGSIKGTLTVDGATVLNSTLTTKGVASFTNTDNSTSKSTGAVKISGGLGVEKRASANEVMIGDHVTMKYNSTDASLEFVFS